MNQSAVTNCDQQLRRCAPTGLTLFGSAVAVLVLYGTMAAQDGRPDGTQQAAPSVAPAAEVPADVKGAAGRIQYVGPDTYILLDAEGRPQPVPGMTYEDFLEAWKKSQVKAKSADTPRYLIDKVEATGRAQENYATLDFTATVRILTDGEIDVPLGLAGALLNGEPKLTSEVENATKPNPPENDHVIQNEEQGGLVAVVTGKAGERRIISLRLIVPLVRDGAETAMQFSCPKALSSNLTLETAGPVSQVTVNSGTLVEQRPTQNKGTQIKIAGPTGPLRLTWQSGANGSGEFDTVLSASGALRFSIDGRSLRSEATLTVQSFGREFDHFRVRLPPGAQLIPEQPTEGAAETREYRISLERDKAGSPTAARQTVLVHFAEQQQAPVTVRMSTEQPIGLDGGEALQLGGFEVIGAVRQYGDILLDVADDWQARWEVGRNVRQVNATDLATTLQGASPTAVFQYDRQPWSLGVRVAARQSRVLVTPQYELQYLDDEARLTLRLNYQIYGARVFEFRVRSEGWELTSAPLESGGLVDQDRVYVEGGTLVLPLSQASSARAETSLTMRRALPAGETRFELPLPVPVANFVGTGEVVVRATNGFELRPDVENSRGLSPAVATDAHDERIATADLRFRTFSPEPVFVAERLKRIREISVDGVAEIKIGQAEIVVEQRLKYDVRHEPLQELEFIAPAGFQVDSSTVEAVLVSDPASSEAAIEDDGPQLEVAEPADAESITGKPNRVRFALPLAQSGQFAVRIRQTLPRPDIAAAPMWSAPMLRPVGAKTSGWRARVESPRDVSVELNTELAGPSWYLDRTLADREYASRIYDFFGTEAAIPLALILSPLESNPTVATTIDRVWLQTWFSGDVRQDRAAMLFRSPGSQAIVELSPQTTLDEIEILVDGKPAEIVSRSAGRINVRLSKRSETVQDVADAKSWISDENTHVLEVRSRQPIQLSLLTRHRLTPPQLLGATSLSQVYWQVVLPADLHIVRAPQRMIPASEWQWLGSFWGREPLLLQPDLEKWIGATNQIAPSTAHNEYLYTGLAPALSIDLITAPRWLVVLAASSAALAAGLAWIYVPALRRRWFLILFAAFVAALAVAFPVPALLLGQAAILGIVVATVAALLARLSRRPAVVPIVLSGGSSRQASRSESILMPPVMATASTAPTVPLRTPETD